LLRQSLKFLTRLRWRAHFRENPSSKEKRENFGLKSYAKAPEVKSLLEFEKDFFDMITKLKFRKNLPASTRVFQNNLRNETQKLTNSNTNIIVKGDKSNNWYTLPVEEYKDLALTNIKKFYKKEKSDAILNTINSDIEHYASKYDVLDRVNKIQRPLQECFITLKDHKVNYQHTKPCRLINPAKSDLGVLSKRILDIILGSLRETISPQLNQFKDVGACLLWFKKLEKERTKALVSFDIKEFYPSISEDILRNALIWAKNTVPDYLKEQCDSDLILAARKSILVFDTEIWTKKVDISM